MHSLNWCFLWRYEGRTLFFIIQVVSVASAKIYSRPFSRPKIVRVLKSLGTTAVRRGAVSRDKRWPAWTWIGLYTDYNDFLWIWSGSGL